ncbi:MAG: hypothetical protein E7058_00825 [Lentisphaerae bacterium]|nr:hypothetical protein [Lentisphaerota bacterium]
MEENKSVITNEFDRSGRYDAGLKALAKSLRVAFLLLLIGIIATLIYFFSGAGYFSVEPQQAVIVSRFGKIVGVYTTGGHWFLPYPVNQFIRVQTSQQLLEVEFAAAASPNGESGSLEPGKDNYIMTGDANVVHSSWTIAYRVDNPQKYYCKLLTPQFPVENGKVMPDDEFVDADGMTGTRGPVTYLRNLFRRAVITVTSGAVVNDILYAGQSEYSSAVAGEFRRLVAAGDSGIVIDNVALNRIYPPAKTKDAFEEVTAAANKSSAMRNEALAYQKTQENEAVAASRAIVADAEKYRNQVQKQLEARSTYFKRILENQNSGTLTMALYTEMLKEVAAAIQGDDSDKFVLGPQGGTMWMKLNREPKTSSSGQNAQGGK